MSARQTATDSKDHSMPAVVGGISTVENQPLTDGIVDGLNLGAINRAA